MNTFLATTTVVLVIYACFQTWLNGYMLRKINKLQEDLEENCWY